MRWNRTIPILLLVLAVCVAAALAAVVFGGGPQPPRAEPAWAERPGGFDPVGPFDDTASELEYRGADCRSRETADDELFREC